MNEMNNRNKMNTLCGWLQYSYRRVKARNHIINLSMKWKYANAGTILIYFYRSEERRVGKEGRL